MSTMPSGGHGLAQEIAHLSLVNAQQSAAPDTMSLNEIPNPPRTTSQVRFQDITADFTRAASTLQIGQLVKDEHFTLFESVGALEIMDSKMDSGYLEPGETLEDDYDILRELLPEEVVGIMDQLLCCEVRLRAPTKFMIGELSSLAQMAWHMGHPLSQTLFTSIYIDRLLWPEAKELGKAKFSRVEGDVRGGPWVHLVLRAYCLGLVKCCDFVHMRVACEQFYEEEDFVTHLYNRNLFSSFSVKDIQQALSDALQYVTKTTVHQSIRDSIVSRLRLRIRFLSALERGLEVAEDRTSEEWCSCLRVLPSVADTNSLAKPVEESFSLKIQRRLASSVPPRPMVKISFEDAMVDLKRLCKDAIDVLQVLDFHGSNNLLDSVWALQSRRPQPSVYVRSFLQSLIFFDMKALRAMSLKQLLYNDLAEVTLPASPLLDRAYEEVELPSDPRFQIAKSMDEFVQRMGSAYIDVFRTLCLNRSRIRRTLCHTILDWDSLQIDAEELDSTLRNLTKELPLTLPHLPTPSFSLPLSSWTYHRKLHMLRHVIQLGFELSIYAPDELAGMYWYLSNICQAHIQHLDRIKTFTSHYSKEKEKAPSKPPLLSSSSRAVEKSLSYLRKQRIHLTATSALAATLHALYILLARHALIPSPPRPYSSDALRYELRMKPFLPITLPELVPFADFARESACPGTSDARLLDYAARNVAEARKAWDEVLRTCRTVPPATGDDAIGTEWERDVKDVVRASIGASIAVAGVKKALAARAMDAVKVDVPEAGAKGSWHVWWVVPRISQRN